MVEEFGNLWDLPGDVRCVTTNGTLKLDGSVVMGRGCAYEAKSRYPGIEFHLGRMVQIHGNHVHELPHGLVSFPVKHHWRDRADVGLISQSAHELLHLANHRPSWRQILLPRPGCGNGRLDWKEVGPILAEILDDERFVVVTNE